MILEEDSLLQFNFDPTTDILSVNLPDMIGTPLSEIENSIKKLAHNVSYFDVKKILIDVRTGVIGVDDTHYQEFVKKFAKIISHTRLEKIARINSGHPARDYLIENYSLEMQNKFAVNFEVRIFPNRAEALAWLKK